VFPREKYSYKGSGRNVSGWRGGNAMTLEIHPGKAVDLQGKSRSAETTVTTDWGEKPGDVLS